MPSTNPRTIALCIALFLLSALVTSTVKLSHIRHPHLSLPSFRGSRKSPQANLAAPRLAYATFLAAADSEDDDHDAIPDEEDGYYVSTRVFAYQLLHSKTAGTNHSLPFLVLCTTDVAKRKRDRLKRDGATIVLVEKLRSHWVQPSQERWRDVLVKLRLFQLSQYHQILFIDADTLVTKPLDAVFPDEATLTQSTLANAAEMKQDEAPLPRTYMFASHGDSGGYNHAWPPNPDQSYLNSGFFIFRPDKELFKYYLSLLKLEGRFHPGLPEQGLLNYAHRKEGTMPWQPLWYGWNVNWPTEKDWRGGAHSFHAKFWDGDPSHDPGLRAIWKQQKAEMEGYYRGRDEGGR